MAARWLGKIRCCSWELRFSVVRSPVTTRTTATLDPGGTQTHYRPVFGRILAPWGTNLKPDLAEMMRARATEPIASRAMRVTGLFRRRFDRSIEPSPRVGA